MKIILNAPDNFVEHFNIGSQFIITDICMNIDKSLIMQIKKIDDISNVEINVEVI